MFLCRACCGAGEIVVEPDDEVGASGWRDNWSIKSLGVFCSDGIAVSGACKCAKAV